MGSRKEEERNEKIIRGLMKLPPNRRCINCNSLGPQYVCTNFWTFVCITCSGIHREFTHRVKSVSMAKFSSQEVEALQKGGNQRAREIYLKDWDQQRQRLPDSSNVDRVREFIKNVYVDRRYAGGKTSDRPPRDLQSLKTHEDETRRASSYHSYSQSPPYDHQYEDRRYGKQGAGLTRKPGSDRGLYDGNISSFIYSPGRLHDQMYEDRLSNEGSFSRASDSSDIQSPNSQKDVGFSRPSIRPSRHSSFDDGRRQTQRTAFLGSFESSDGRKPTSLLSVNSASLLDLLSEHEKPVDGSPADISATPAVPLSSVSSDTANLDLFEAPSVPQTVTSSSTVDLFQLSTVPSTYQPPPTNVIPSMSLDLFAEDKISAEFSAMKNEGWATFDVSQQTANVSADNNLAPVRSCSTEGASVDKFDLFLPTSASRQWPLSQNSSSLIAASLISDPWNDGLQSIQGSTGIDSTRTQTWNAFEDTTGQLPFQSFQQSSGLQLPVPNPSSDSDQYFGLGDSKSSHKSGFDRATSDGRSTVLSGPPPVMESSFTPSFFSSSQPGTASNGTTAHKSSNPFDLPYESALESSNVFLGMNSLQAALPNGQLPPSFLAPVSQPWFPQNSVTYIAAAPQSGLAYIAGQSPTSQLPNVTAQGPVASVGGNPFA